VRSLQSLLVWLGNYGHLSYEKQQELLQELGQIAVGTGTAKPPMGLSKVVVRYSGATRRMGENVAMCRWTKRRSWLRVKEWMWVVCGVGFFLFHATADTLKSRVKAAGQDFAGVLSSDDFSVYNGYEVSAQQIMWHLRRHFKQVSKLKHGNNPTGSSVYRFD